MLRALMALCLTVWAFAIPATEAEAQSYRIKPGDVLQIEVLEDSGLNRNVLVLPDGRISLPLAGTVQAGGQTIEQVESTLASALMPNFASRPNVFVSIASLAERQPRTGGPAVPQTIDVYVLGEANRPGKLSVDPGTTVLQLFSEMGGFSNFAATKRIQLRRTEKSGAEKIYRLNYDAIQDGRSKNGLATLSDGDVIIVPQRGLFE